MTEVLGCKNLSYQIPGRTLFDQLNFHLRKGEFVAVLGRNGAGKTTLLKALTGEVKPLAGDVEIFGKPLNSWAARPLALRRAVLSQSTSLNFAFEVIEVVLMGRIPHQEHQQYPGQDLKIALAALEKVGLLGFEKRNYMHLSGGEQQRVHLARVLAQLEGPIQDRLLFLDEPTSSLDISSQHKIMGIAKGFCREGGAVFGILHDLNLAARYADKVLLLLGEGRYLFGAVHEVLTTEALSQTFEHEVQVVRHPSKDEMLILT